MASAKVFGPLEMLKSSAGAEEIWRGSGSSERLSTICEEPGEPSAPQMSLYPGRELVGACGGATREDTQHSSLLEKTIKKCWPYDPSNGQVAWPPLATTQVPQVIRVYRDPKSPNYTTGLERLPDLTRREAQEKGWEGPWELTHWGRPIEEVVRDLHLKLEELPEVPREEGARHTNLHYSTTSLDLGEPGTKKQNQKCRIHSGTGSMAPQRGDASPRNHSKQSSPAHNVELDPEGTSGSTDGNGTLRRRVLPGSRHHSLGGSDALGAGTGGA